jgi:hypothetical protein
MRLHDRRTIVWKGYKTCERACTACDSMYTLIKVILLEMVCAAVHALKTLDIKLDFNNLPRRHNRLCRQVVFVPWVVPRYLDPTPIYSNYSTACSKVHGSNSAWA